MNKLTIKIGNIFDENVECIVNPWNMNFIPFFLLYSHGVSGQLKKKTGYKPFMDLLRFGIIKSGEARITDGGKLNQKIIHVAGLKWYWVSSLYVVEKCTINALKLAEQKNIKSIVFPLIGTGVGGLNEADVEQVMSEAIKITKTNIDVILVKYRK